MRLSESTKVALTACAGILAALALLALLNGCGKKPAEVPATVLSTTGTATVYEIPVKQVKDKEITPAPGKNDEDVIAVITVQPRDEDNKPVGKPVTVQVYKQPKSLTRKAKEIITGDSGSPDYSVTADSKDVQARTERDRGIWPYLAGIAALIAGFIAARKWLKRFGWVVKALGWAKKLIGL